MTSRFGYPPASFFGMPLGILGLGLAWRAAVRLWPLPVVVPELILGAGCALWAILVLLYHAKWLFRRADAIAELEHPVACCFVGLGPVTTSLVGLAALPYARPVAVVAFAAGALATFAFALFRTGRLWQGGREPGATTAILYLPAVAGSFVTATAAGVLGWKDWGQLAFGAGMFSWLAIESVLLHRLYTADALPAPLRPTLGIQLAPPAVGALAYLNVGPGQPDMFVQALMGYALLQVGLLARLWRWLTEQPFSPSYWAFSFGSAALAAATVRLALAGAGVERVLAMPVFAVANLIIGVLAVRSLLLLVPSRGATS
jgi:tellurite resistance protein